MFLSVLNWMLAHVPRFMQPGIGWLLDGLRSITNYISQRWNALGDTVNRWWQRVNYWGTTVYTFCWRLHYFAIWLVRVRIPGAVTRAVNAVIAWASDLIEHTRLVLMTVLAQLREWATAAFNATVRFIDEVKQFAREWIDRIRGVLSGLIRTLEHVLNGPVVLAEWLAGAMWAATLRLLYAQRDRVFSWLLRESRVFSVWLARELEDLIVRWL